MLTANLIVARRRGDRIAPQVLKGARRVELERLSTAMLQVLRSQVGQSRQEVLQALEALPSQARDKKIIAGLRKLALDGCEFEEQHSTLSLPAADLRAQVFTAAAAMRRQALPDQPFDASQCLLRVAATLQAEAGDVRAALYADLKSEHRLIAVAPGDGAALLQQWDHAQLEALLLKATQVTVWLCGRHAAEHRRFFAQLKFRRLLFQVQREDEGYRVVIDGPLSLFRAARSYGLQLALVLRALGCCQDWRLVATLNWGSERRPVQLHLESSATETRAPLGDLDSPWQRFVAGFKKLSSDWSVREAGALLPTPDGSVCVPDLLFQHISGTEVFLERLGYWSRPAVWRRVEWVEAGFSTPVIFAVEAKLRVSAEALDADAPSHLYVFRGTMAPRSVLAMLAHHEPAAA